MQKMEERLAHHREDWESSYAQTNFPDKVHRTPVAVDLGSSEDTCDTVAVDHCKDT